VNDPKRDTSLEELVEGMYLTARLDDRIGIIHLDEITKVAIVRLVAGQPGGITQARLYGDTQKWNENSKPPHPRVGKVKRTAPHEESGSSRPRRKTRPGF
jgi:hypothetical protein